MKSKENLLSLFVVVLIGITAFLIYKLDQVNKIIVQQNEIIQSIEIKQAEDDLYLREWIAEVHNRALSNVESSTFESFEYYVNKDIQDLKANISIVQKSTEDLNQCFDSLDKALAIARTYSSFKVIYFNC